MGVACVAWAGASSEWGKGEKDSGFFSTHWAGLGMAHMRGSDTLFSGLILPSVLSLLRYLQALQHRSRSVVSKCLQPYQL